MSNCRCKKNTEQRDLETPQIGTTLPTQKVLSEFFVAENIIEIVNI